MAIRPVMRNLLTGRPVQVKLNLSLDRNTLRQGIIYSGARGTGDVNQLKQIKLDLTPETLGEGAVRVPNSLGKRVNLTA